MNENNSRTHEPSLRELVSELDGFRELMNERDRRYGERFDAQQEAVQAALASAEKLTAAAFNAAEKAISKQEAAQQNYNERTNEFRGQLSDQANRLMPRLETEQALQRFREDLDRLRIEINELRQSRSKVEGAEAKAKDYTALIFSVIGVVIAFLAAGIVVATK